jgi:superfamily II DNA or RNA helicase
MDLRQYQLDAVEEVIKSYENGSKKTLLVLPTASGKTVIASEIAKNFNNVIWAAHRKELLEQASNFGKFRLKSVFSNSDAQCDLLVIDECHHIPANTISSFIKNTSYNNMLGITATPDRLDNMGLAFDAIVYGASIEELINDGYLTPIDLYSIRTPYDSDFALIEYLYTQKINNSVLFVKNKEHGRLFLNSLSQAYKISEIYGDSDRELILNNFKNNNIDILISCMILTEGTDLPNIKNIVLARQTNSKSLIKQMIGRGLRKHKTKDQCNVYECIDMRSSTSIASIMPIRNHTIISRCGKEWNVESIKNSHINVFDELMKG